MKKIFIFLFLFPIILTASIGNFQFDKNIIRGSKIYLGLKYHSNKLYLLSSNYLGEYSINSSGDIMNNNTSVLYSENSPILFGDSLYVYDMKTFIPGESIPQNKCLKVFDISNQNMVLSDSLIVDSDIYKISVNKNYIFVYYYDSYMDSKVYRRSDFEYITSIATGTHFAVNDTLLYMEMVNQNQSALAIYNIKNLENIFQIGFLETGNYQPNIRYYFQDDTLFISRRNEVLIIDISNPTHPHLLSIINNIPNFDNNLWIGSLLKWNDYLLITSANKLWVYNLQNLETPTLLSYYTNDKFSETFDNLAKSENFIYYSGSPFDIFKINLRSLPNIEILSTYKAGQSNFTNERCLFENRLLISQEYEIDSLRTLSYDLNTNNSVLIENIGNYYVNKIGYDSLFVGFNFKNNIQKISLFRYENGDFVMKDSLLFSTERPYYKFDYINGILIIMDQYQNMRYYSITNSYHIRYISSTSTQNDRYYNYSERTSNCTLNYFYFNTIDENYVFRTSIREAQYPFSEIYNGRLSVNGYYEYFISLLSNDKVILYHYNDNNLFTYKLCNYTFPDSFELLDTYTTDKIFKFHNNYILGINQIIPNEVSYFIWTNDEIEEVYSFDFGYPVYDNIFLPEQNKLIAVGDFEINIYNCEYEETQNNEISNIYPIKIYNYPNPFNPSTTISFNSEKRIKNTQIAIYNLKGQKIRNISVENCKAGTNKVVWDGKDNTGKKVASGVYLYSLKQNGKTIATKKMIMLK